MFALTKRNNITTISDTGTYIWIVDRTLNQYRCLCVSGIGGNQKTCSFSVIIGLNKKISLLRTAFSWVITQRVLVIPYRRFRTTCLSHLQGSRIPKRTHAQQFFFVNSEILILNIATGTNSYRITFLLEI
jgi:hypothetical protein